MQGIRWIKSFCGYPKKVHNYNAEIGHILLCCRPSIEYLGNYSEINVIGWTCTLYFGNTQIGQTKREKPLELVQKEAEKLAIKYLFGYGFVALKALKKMNLLEEALSEIGVDLE